jgi:RNA polymerase sigma-70 factor (ECF subfamily)
MADGDDDGFEAIYWCCAPALLRYLRRRLPHADAEDVAAETFVVVWRRLGEVPSDPLPWVIGVARNQLRNAARGEQRRSVLVERIRTTTGGPRVLPEHISGGPSDVVAALAALSTADRELLLLVGWDELDAAQSAAVLGCSRGAFRVRLHRARKRLAEQLEGTAQQHPDEGEVR